MSSLPNHAGFQIDFLRINANFSIQFPLSRLEICPITPSRFPLGGPPRFIIKKTDSNNPSTNSPAATDVHRPTSPTSNIFEMKRLNTVSNILTNISREKWSRDITTFNRQLLLAHTLESDLREINYISVRSFLWLLLCNS